MHFAPNTLGIDAASYRGDVQSKPCKATSAPPKPSLSSDLCHFLSSVHWGISVCCLTSPHCCSATAWPTNRCCFLRITVPGQWSTSLTIDLPFLLENCTDSRRSGTFAVLLSSV